VVQALGGRETISMVERYTKSLSFDDSLNLYKAMNSDGQQIVLDSFDSLTSPSWCLISIEPLPCKPRL